MTEKLRDSFHPSGLATAIGSFPHADPGPALELIFRELPAAPAWPQLPKRGLKENMCPQFSAGMPALVVDREKNRIYFQVGDDLMERLEEFYLKVIEDDPEAFAIGKDYAAGFHAFIHDLSERDPFPFIKGCVTGPITFGLTITDQNRKPSLYHPEIFDAIVKTIAMKARWQIQILKDHCRIPILFIDEPYLASVGSALVSLKEDEVIEKLNEVIAAIHGSGALAGVHCCANTDWSILLRTDIDILSFDAYAYARNLLLYGSLIREYLLRGGALAWGITPSTEDIDRETVDSLWENLMGSWRRLEKEGISRAELKASALITPSCGMGTVTVKQCEKIMEFNHEISERIQAFVP